MPPRDALNKTCICAQAGVADTPLLSLLHLTSAAILQLGGSTNQRPPGSWKAHRTGNRGRKDFPSGSLSFLGCWTGSSQTSNSDTWDPAAKTYPTARAAMGEAQCHLCQPKPLFHHPLKGDPPGCSSPTSLRISPMVCPSPSPFPSPTQPVTALCYFPTAALPSVVLAGPAAWRSSSPYTACTPGCASTGSHTSTPRPDPREGCWEVGSTASVVPSPLRGGQSSSLCIDTCLVSLKNRHQPFQCGWLLITGHSYHKPCCSPRCLGTFCI